MDVRRFWNPSLPQTLIGAVFLLYGNVLFALLFRQSGAGGLYGLAFLSVLRTASAIGLAGNLANLATLLTIVGSGAAAYLIVNERKIGWRIGIPVAALPVVCSVIVLVAGYPFRPRLFDVIDVGLLFDVALLGLLLHSQSKDHIRIWFK